MKEIILTKGYYAQIDDEYYEELIKHKWRTFINGAHVYAIANINRKVIFMHRFLLGITDLEIVVDHRDRNGLNNQKQNLRPCTRVENGRNTVSTPNTSSKYLGVSFYKASKKWSAQIHVMYKKKFLGYYEIEEDAAKAYDKAAKELFGEFANLNFK